MRRKDEQLLGWLSFGAFLIIVGTLFLINPDLASQIEKFITNFELKQVSGNFYFPTPKSPHHPTLYNSLAMFCFAYGTYQILLLILKFALRAEPTKKTETFTSIIFWLTTGFALSMLKDRTIEWLIFIAVLIILAAIILIIRSVASIIFKKHAFR